MLATQLRILRVFGLAKAEVAEVLRTAQEDGCPGLRLLEKDGEFAVCVQASAPTQAMADSYCDKWVQKLAARFDAALYGTGEISLAQASLDALLKKRRLLVAADPQTGRIIGALLRPLDHSEAVFDFGTQTYGNPENARQIITPPALLKKFPGDVLQAAAGRAGMALAASGADYAVLYMPTTVGQAPFVLLCDKRGALACAVNPELTERAIGNNILDLVRRRALGLKPTSATVSFRPGRETPLLLVSQSGQMPAAPRPVLRRRSHAENMEAAARTAAAQAYGGAVRTPARAAAAPAAPLSGTFEPVSGLDPAQAEETTTEFAVVPEKDAPAPPLAKPAQPESPVRPMPMAPAAESAEPPARTAAATAAAVAAAARAAAERSWRETEPPRTAPAGTPQPAKPAPSGTITFEVPEEPAAPAAPAVPETAAPRRGSRRTPAPAAVPEEEPAAPEEKSAPAHSILDDDIPDFATPAPAAPAEVPRTREAFRAAAKGLFDQEGSEEDTDELTPDAVMDPARNHSLAMVERAERRQRRVLTALFVLLVAVIVAGASLLVVWLQNGLGAKPESSRYGTASFDKTAASYLNNALEKRENVAGYLAFPGAEGSLVYTAEHTEEQGTEETKAPQLAGTFRLGGAAAGNTVIECGGRVLAGMDQAETLAANSGFTLYTAGETYRFKVFAVYYLDETESGADAFPLREFGDLSGYYRYLSFVLECRARSLFDTGIPVGQNAGFLTLISAGGENDTSLCVVGRLIGQEESAQLQPSAITPAEEPLMPAAVYAARGQQAPDAAAKLSAALDWYNAQAAAAAPAPEEPAEPTADAASAAADTGELTAQVAELQQKTQALLTSADALLEGLTDVAGQGDAAQDEVGRGAEGSVPDKTVSAAELAAAPAPTAAPTEVPAATPAPQPEAVAAQEPESAPAPTPEPTQQPAQEAAPGETIAVTMNGTAQDMDLVTCLAMVAQNELGSNAPMEAYKAQCVATHCWILSQGGYPAVLGAEPGSAALQAAQEVAHVLVSYNGNVCFTPYFASASTGTASAQEVWGNEVAYLQAVESPYDQSAATNWNTNGQSSGTARFSREAVGAAISEKLGIDLSGVEPGEWFRILTANQYGWVAQMQIGPDGGAGTTTCSGRWFRENLLAGRSVDGRSLRSQCFTFTYDAGLDCFLFDVYGYGHGCGMSQWGAVGYAQNGWSYDAILTHYFTGATLTTY